MKFHAQLSWAWKKFYNLGVRSQCTCKCNATFNWITSFCEGISCDILSQTWRLYVTSLFSGFMQLASGLITIFMQLVHKNRDNHIKDFHFRGEIYISSDSAFFRKFRFTADASPWTKFPTVYPTIYLPKWKKKRNTSMSLFILIWMTEHRALLGPGVIKLFSCSTVNWARNFNCA